MMNNIYQTWTAWARVWASLARPTRVRISFTFLVSTIAVLCEFLGLGVVIPYLKVVSDPSLAYTNNALNQFFELISWQGSRVVFLGIFCIIFVLISSLMGFFGTYLLGKLAAQVSAESANVVFTNILSRNYRYHLGHSTNQLIAKISHVNSIGNGFISPLFGIFSRLIILVCTFVALMIVNPTTTIIGMSALAIVYIGIYRLVSTRVKAHGRHYLSETVNRQKTMNEAFRGVKEILVSGTQSTYVAQFDKGSQKIWHHLTTKSLLAQFPKFFLEGVAFSSLLLLVLIFVVNGGEVEQALTEVGFFAVLGYRVLPSVQLIYAHMISITGTLPSINDIANELSPTDVKQKSITSEFLFQELSFKDVRFRYENDKDVVRSISFVVRAGEKVAIVGPSGAGKSTVVDIILGLVSPSDGSFLVNGESYPESEVSRWQSVIAYVPQNIFILEDSLEKNVKFGSQIDSDDAVGRAVKLACCDGFTTSESFFAESGKNLSGGQRQRIGIARAIYRESSILLLDEATSALDPETERQVWHNLVSLNKTIVLVTHRMALAKKCDKVIFLVDGRVEAEGSYEELMQRSPLFQQFVADEEKKETE